MLGKFHERVDALGRVSKVLALCDEGLLGRVYKEGEAVIDLKKYRNFYEGRLVSEEEAVSWLKEARNINLVGEKAVACAKNALSIRDKAVKRVAGVPHLQIYYL